MAGTSVALPRRLLVFGLAILVSLSSILYGASMAKAEQMVASWYGPGFEGLTTANGEVFDPNDYTAAHKSLPFNTKLIVTYEGKSVAVRINDRGPYVAGRDLDLSQAAAEYIGLTRVGTATVQVDYADPATATGPYDNGSSNNAPKQQPENNASEPRREEPSETDKSAAEDQYGQEASGTEQETPAQTAAEDQYGQDGSQEAARDQYGQAADTAAEDQYAEPSLSPAPRDSMGTGVPVPPSPPDPGSLQAPPAELVKPGSTVEKRVILVYAAPPPGLEELAGQQATTASAEQSPKPEAAPIELASAPSSDESSAAPVELASAGDQESPEASPEESAQASYEASGGELAMLPDTGGAPFGALLLGGLLLGCGLLLRRLVR